MNILVINVAASEGGALTILKKYYEEFKNDPDNKYFLCISTPVLKETSNIKIFNFPWVKKSWFHRLWFDKFTVKKIIKSQNIQKIFSLQNTAVFGTNLPQDIYMHQPLPFVEHKFKFFKAPLLWVYQNIVSKKIFISLKKANNIFVQTQWVKKAIIEKCGVSSSKIHITSVEVNIPENLTYNETSLCPTFFYPSGSYIYKNHETIVNACSLLKSRGSNNFKVIFTLKGDESRLLKKLKKRVIKENLSIEFVGSLSYEDVLEMYSQSILLFPSYVETFGLPLLEAKLIGSYIIASDCSFSKEVLGNYEKAYYFSPFDYHLLANHMSKLMSSI